MELDVRSIEWRKTSTGHSISARAAFECGFCSDPLDLSRQLDIPRLFVQSMGVCPEHGSELQVEHLSVQIDDLDAVPGTLVLSANLSCASCDYVETLKGRDGSTAQAAEWLAVDGVAVELREDGLRLEAVRETVLVAVATDVEVEAVLEAFGGSQREPRTAEFGRYFDLGVLGGKSVLLVRSEAGSVGPSGSAVTLMRALAELRPSAVIMTGICFGTNQNKHRIGDVVVGTQLLSYEPQRVGTGSGEAQETVIRGDRVSASPRLLNWFRAGLPAWTGQPVHFGVLMSGEKLVDNISFRRALETVGEEALGGEMEGAGLYSAAAQAQCDWIVVKAICDWADGDKKKNKKRRQAIAAAGAAALVQHVLAQGPNGGASGHG